MIIIENRTVPCSPRSKNYAKGTVVNVSGSTSTSTFVYTPTYDEIINALKNGKDYITIPTILEVYGDLYSLGEVSAFGAGSGAGGGSGLIQTVYGLSGLGGTYSDATLTDTFNAYTINSLHNRINSLEDGSALNFTTSGSGNVVTSVTKSGTSVSIIKGLTAVLEGDTRLTNNRPSPYALTFSGYSTATYDGSAAISVALPTKVSQLTNDSGYLTSIDADLVAIAALTATSGLLRKTAANTWSLDTNAYLTAITKAQVEAVLTGNITTHTHSQYLTGNQTITLSGDATGSGTTSIALTLANSGVTAGTYNNSATQVRPFTVDSKGRITSIGAAIAITPSWNNITNTPTTLAGYNITDAIKNNGLTESYVPRYTSSGFVNSNIYDNGTDVVIGGATNPHSPNSALNLERVGFSVSRLALTNKYESTESSAVIIFITRDTIAGVNVLSGRIAAVSRVTTDTVPGLSIMGSPNMYLSSFGFVNVSVNTIEKININSSNILVKAPIISTYDITAPTFTGALIGNADTATKLATARTISGVSFDGSTNIDIPFANLSSIPTTLSGYGITDAYTKIQTDGFLALKLDSSIFNDLFEKVNVGTVSAPVYAIKAKYNFYSVGEVSAFGAGAGSGGSGLIQTVYGYAGLGSTYSDATLTDTFNAYTINRINNDLSARIASLESGSAIGFTTVGNGNAVTSVIKSGVSVIVTKGLTFSVDGHTHSFSGLTGLPTTLAGYGITDAYTKTYVDATYLKLTGGTLSGSLSATNYLRSDGATIWHSGNDGVGSGLDADTLDGIHKDNLVYWNSEYGRFSGDLNTLGGTGTSGIFNIGGNVTNSAFGDPYGTLFAFWNSDISTQLHIPYNGDRIAWRKSIGTTYTGSTWKYVWDSDSFDPNSKANTSGTYSSLNVGYATSSGNAATATKLSNNRTNWADTGVIDNVVGELAWRAYGNGHTMFDASNGYTPNGTVCSKENPTVEWSATYPTLMGYNGQVTFGVRVDSSRMADILRTGRYIFGQYFDGSGNVSGAMSGVSNLTMSGALSGGTTSSFSSYSTANRFYTGYDSGQANSISCSNWFISNGESGWYNATYVGGIHMTDSTYVRVFNSKSFWVNNNIVATGEITAFGASDIRLKDNVKPISSALDFLSRVKTYEFDWNDKALSLNPLKTKKGAGVIAQEMQSLDSDFVHSIYGDYLGVDYERFIPYLIGGVNELSNKMYDYVNRLDRAEKRVAELESEVKRLIA